MYRYINPLGVCVYTLYSKPYSAVVQTFSIGPPLALIISQNQIPKSIPKSKAKNRKTSDLPLSCFSTVCRCYTYAPFVNLSYSLNWQPRLYGE